MNELLNDNLDIELDLDIFEIDEKPKKPNNIKNSFVKVKHHKGVKVAKYRNAQKMVNDIGNIEENDHISAIVSGDFIAGDFIEAYLFENELIAEEIIISTLSMSRENVDSLKNIQDYRLKGKMGLLISDFYFSHEKHRGILDIAEKLGNGEFALGVAGLHTKITLIKTECGKHLVIGGSANLRSSLNILAILKPYY